jgi:hypothetical protein
MANNDKYCFLYRKEKDMYKAVVYFDIFQDVNCGMGIRCDTETVIETVEDDGMEALMKLLAKVTSGDVTLSKFYGIYETVENKGVYDFGHTQNRFNIHEVSKGEIYVNSGLKIIKPKVEEIEY